MALPSAASTAAQVHEVGAAITRRPCLSAKPESGSPGALGRGTTIEVGGRLVPSVIASFVSHTTTGRVTLGPVTVPVSQTSIATADPLVTRVPATGCVCDDDPRRDLRAVNDRLGDVRSRRVQLAGGLGRRRTEHVGDRMFAVDTSVVEGGGVVVTPAGGVDVLCVTPTAANAMATAAATATAATRRVRAGRIRITGAARRSPCAAAACSVVASRVAL